MAGARCFGARALLVVLAAGWLLGPGALAAWAQGVPSAPPVGAATAGLVAAPASPATAAEEVARMAEAVNALRAQSGLPPLRVQFQLSLAAQRHAEDMAARRTLSHTDPTGGRPSDRMAAFGYDTCGGGENVAFGALQTVDDVARGWYDSPGHRAILLDPRAREMGIGRGQTPDGLVFWALEVGQRPAVAPIVINGEAAATPTSEVAVYVAPEVSDYCLGPPRRITQVTLSNRPDFADAQTFPYSPVLRWTLAPGEGPRTVYARLTDAGGQTVEAQDDILVSSTAPPPSTATNLSPPVRTLQLTGPDGRPLQVTVFRTSQIVPPDAAVTTVPCPGSLTGCLTVAPAPPPR